MFQGWDNFYFMIGAAAASLIGLLFVVVTLTTGSEREQALRGQALFMTPTALNFSIVLSISAVTMAPGLAVWLRATVYGAIALAGLASATRAGIGIAKLPIAADTIHWSDVWMYGATPTLVYFGLLVGAVAVGERAAWAPYAMATMLLALLFVGIRNAWDLVTWIAPKRRRDGE